MWNSISIGGRSTDIFMPADRPRFVLFFLPDLDDATPSQSSEWTALLSSHRLACISPHGGESWWSSQICPSFDPENSAEHYLLHQMIPWTHSETQLSSRSLALVGAGAGGQGALRLGFKHPEQFRVVASLAGSIDHYELYGRGTCLDEMYSSREHCRQDGAILHVQPMNWPPYLWFSCDPDSPWLRGNDRLHEKLRALGVPHTIDFTTRACGHSWAYYDHMAPAMLNFVVDGLEKESRRLL